MNLLFLVLSIWYLYHPLNFENTICCATDTVMMTCVYMAAFFLTNNYKENGA